LYFTLLHPVRLPLREDRAHPAEVRRPPGPAVYAGLPAALLRPLHLLLDLRRRLARGAHLLPRLDVDRPLALGARRGAPHPRAPRCDRRCPGRAPRSAARPLPPRTRPSMIRIAYMIDHLHVGGAQRHLLEVVRGLDRDRYALEMWTASPDAGDLGP